jgi:hypothetical protein
MLSQLTDTIVNGLLLGIVLGSDLGPVRPYYRPAERMDLRYDSPRGDNR